ncbi:ParB N-terminal domain-containing protein [Methylobacterium sp. Leaf456]|uniref:ParB N-terminal domain-containing protein n=1 Tax=Methylobacterium sp. Leaf456 TaxID=1736382 RepID=UPI0009E9F8C4|nr:ParB N-terminal domain-containing protein [Methylobacterium sp. Leaf456]
MVREEHARELIRTVRAVGGALAPVLVVPIGEKFYLVDGHHRIIAYRSMEWIRSVPVEYFEGSLYEAKLEALNRNVKSQLPLSTSEKSEAAWELVRDNKLAVRVISKQTSISERTVKSMRKAVKTLGAEAASEITWAEARRRDWKSDEDYDPDAAKREKAERVAAAILRNTGVSIRRDPRILADALEIIDSNIPNWMILNWSDRVKPLMDKYPDDFPEPLDI